MFDPVTWSNLPVSNAFFNALDELAVVRKGNKAEKIKWSTIAGGLYTRVAPPPAANSPGAVGQMAHDANHLYLHTGTGWLRFAKEAVPWADWRPAVKDAFGVISDGAQNATASGLSNLLFRSTDSSVSITAETAHQVYGNNINFTVNPSNLNVGDFTDDDTYALKVHIHDASDVTTGFFSNSRISAGSVTQHESSISHDALAGFLASEHIDHSVVQIVAGAGLSGGGSIAATRTLALDAASLPTSGSIDPDLDYVVFLDANSGTTRRILASAIAGSGGGSSFNINALTFATPVSADTLAFYDISADAQHKVTIANLFANIPHTHNASAFTAGTLDNARIAASNVTQHEAAINHDNLLGFSAAEHVDHTTVTITAGIGLAGGGTIAANRTLFVDINGLPSKSSPDGALDYVMIHDANANSLKKVLLNNLPGGGGGSPTSTYDDDLLNAVALSTDVIAFGDLSAGFNRKTSIEDLLALVDASAISHDSLAGFTAAEHIDHSTVSVLAGDGLSGGGTLEANRYLTLDINSLRLVTEYDNDQFDYLAFHSDGEAETVKISVRNFVASSGLVRKSGLTVGDGVNTAFNFTHNFNNLTPIVQVYEVATGNLALVPVRVVSANQIQLDFAPLVPTANQFRVGVQG